ncbi:hypothetical protein [Rhodococcus sp. AQ5-07]|uniref:hypothetical protein n=1 Tax=Rhodococcus sp. AQ5-07 TaxID=2054902 RepID=UPI000DBF455C|nr:hypothetical protein [Rhodococcus sp. AQ5-07]RAL31136.1 hypothetical protein CVN56_29650 [Rhodococcus sp. AQ5-07]
MIYIDTKTDVSILSTGVVIGVPWNVFGTVVEIGSMATVLASMAVATNTVADIASTAIQIFDVVTSNTVASISSSADVKPSATVISETTVHIGSAATIGSPVAVALMQTIVDIKSEVVSIPTTSFVGTTTVDITSTSTTIPVGVIKSSTSVDITSEGAITSFAPSGMLKSGSFATAPSSIPVVVTGWSTDPAYLGSTIVSNGLAASGTKTATVSASAVFGIRYFNIDYKAELRKNGELIPGTTVTVKGASSGAAPTLVMPSTDVDVVSGDQITLRSSATGFANSVVEGTYLQIT